MHRFRSVSICILSVRTHEGGVHIQTTFVETGVAYDIHDVHNCVCMAHRGTGKVAMQVFLQFENLQRVVGIELSQVRHSVIMSSNM